MTFHIRSFQVEPAPTGLQSAILCTLQFRIQISNKFIPVFPMEHLYLSPGWCRASDAPHGLVLLHVGHIQPSRAMETFPWLLAELAGTTPAEPDVVVWLFFNWITDNRRGVLEIFWENRKCICFGWHCELLLKKDVIDLLWENRSLGP